MTPGPGPVAAPIATNPPILRRLEEIVTTILPKVLASCCAPAAAAVAPEPAVPSLVAPDRQGLASATLLESTECFLALHFGL